MDLVLTVPIDAGARTIWSLDIFREAVQVLVHYLSDQFSQEEAIEACETAILVPVPAEWEVTQN